MHKRIVNIEIVTYDLEYILTFDFTRDTRDNPSGAKFASGQQKSRKNTQRFELRLVARSFAPPYCNSRSIETRNGGSSANIAKIVIWL